MGVREALIGGVFAAALLYLALFALPSVQDGFHPLDGLDTAQMTSLQLLHPSGPVVLQRDLEQGSRPCFEGWRLARHPAAAVDKHKMWLLCSALEQFKPGEPLPSAGLEPRREYGLDPPELVVNVEAAGKSVGLRLGRFVPYLNRRYAQLEGSESLHLVADDLARAAAHPAEQFLALQPFQLSDAEVAAFTLLPVGVRIRRDGEEQWVIASDGNRAADGGRVSAFFRGLQGLEATGLVTQPGTVARYTIEVVKKGGDQPIRLFAGGRNPSEGLLWFEGQSLAYQLKGGLPQELRWGSEHFRERRFFGIASRSEVRELLLQVAGRPDIVVRRQGQEWQVNGKQGHRVFVEELLKDLESVEAEEFPAAWPAGSRPFARVQIRTSNRERKTLLIRAAGNDSAHYYAAVEGTNEIFAVNKVWIRRLCPREEVLLQ